MNVSDIKNVACVGGGVIGSSWAIQYALKGLHVTLYDINDQQLAKSHDQMLRSLDALVAHNAITAARKDEIIACVRPTTSMEEAVQDAQFIQESGPERIEIKRSILAQVEQYAAPDALYASSTSGLLISDIVAEALHPERCIGAHPYNPPHLIPLVELTAATRRTMTASNWPMISISPSARRPFCCVRSAPASLPTVCSWPCIVRCRIW